MISDSTPPRACCVTVARSTPPRESVPHVRCALEVRMDDSVTNVGLRGRVAQGKDRLLGAILTKEDDIERAALLTMAYLNTTSALTISFG